MRRTIKRSGRWYSRKKHFAAQRDLAYARDGETCRISGQPLKFAVVVGDTPGKIMWNRACDHLWPERYLRTYLRGCDPHVLDNLVTVHPSVHAQKTAAEKFLYMGDGVSFYREMNRIGYPRDLFGRAWQALEKSKEAKR